jgi:hypothetical protein
MASNRIPKPASQRISQQRVQLILLLASVGAISLVAFDAFISYQGFRLMALPSHVPLALAGLILLTQLGTGALQQLGMNPFSGVGGSVALDFVWRWVLISIYALDVGSNAIAFGAAGYLNPRALLSSPAASLTMGLVVLLLSLLLTFGDEILLRLADRLAVGARANAAASRIASIQQRAYNEHLRQYEQTALADAKGSAPQIDYEWLEGGEPR